MSSTDYVGYCFGSLVYVSGLAAYAIKKNKVSLGIGSLFGGLAILGAYEASKEPDEPFIAAANAGGLSGVMIVKHMSEMKRGSKASGFGITVLSMVMCSRYCVNIYNGLTSAPTNKK
eukprot:GFUD01002934.1.p1 GENE.GFUD01002934.1~~GFUD01002934.1.p1  ORF type:complete len:117 (-),score=13.13 GFUD01002934.1:168-518(-)